MQHGTSCLGVKLQLRAKIVCMQFFFHSVSARTKTKELKNALITWTRARFNSFLNKCIFPRSIYILKASIKGWHFVLHLFLLIPHQHYDCSVFQRFFTLKRFMWTLLTVNEPENQHWCAFHNDDNRGIKHEYQFNEYNDMK